MTGNSEWAGILDQGEEVVWQGKPASAIRLEFRGPFEPVFFLFFTGFSVFWMVMASQAGGVFWMFGLLFFFVGSFQLVGQHFWKAAIRQRTHYTLTSKRAFVAKNPVFGSRSLESYPLTPETTLALEEGKYTSIYFAERTETRNDSTHIVKIGFELLEDGREVFRKMRDIQQSLEQQ
ncbi:aspartate carbamoyltransferase catalytic subunit [uncultured Litoreibacter sp.]|uniref:aspartate carbamoyltransferase catalytic subunit n=1 Tax=uncultured Litoreibacter sp. TaxID=1392394 RepID=UPI002631D185|nr:aspartate carbamoyltransferase catalytic subunit [uncultured Litoreibacter sp.]